MRALPFALLFLAAPAVAAPPQAARPSAEQAVRVLQEPLAQEMAAGVIDQLVGIVLDTRIPAATLTDPRARPDDTLRDLARRDDPPVEQRLRENTRRAVGTAAAVAGGTMAQAGELKRTAARLEAALAPLIDTLAAAGYDR